MPLERSPRESMPSILGDKRGATRGGLKGDEGGRFINLCSSQTPSAGVLRATLRAHKRPQPSIPSSVLSSLPFHHLHHVPEPPPSRAVFIQLIAKKELPQQYFFWGRIVLKRQFDRRCCQQALHQQRVRYRQEQEPAYSSHLRRRW